MSHTSEQTEIEVIIVSYNAEKYIQQAIESVVSQKTDFPFDVHIYDDCSIDDTCNLVSTFVNKQDTLYLHTSDFNLGTFANLQRAISNCKAEFIALLEGDDYWNDRDKLQEQVDFLKANPQYVGCAANSLVYDQSKESFTGLYNPDLKEQYSLPELFSIPPFQIGTLVYRREFLPSLPNEFKDTISNDKVVYTLLAKYGNIFCLDKPLTVYRKHEKSISNSQQADTIYSKHKLLYSLMKQHFEKKYHPFINKALYDHLKGNILIRIENNKPLKNLFTEYVYHWLKLKKWLTLEGYKDLYYFSSKIF